MGSKTSLQSKEAMSVTQSQTASLAGQDEDYGSKTSITQRERSVDNGEAAKPNSIAPLGHGQTNEDKDSQNSASPDQDTQGSHVPREPVEGDKGSKGSEVSLAKSEGKKAEEASVISEQPDKISKTPEKVFEEDKTSEQPDATTQEKTDDGKETQKEPTGQETPGEGSRVSLGAGSKGSGSVASQKGKTGPATGRNLRGQGPQNRTSVRGKGTPGARGGASGGRGTTRGGSVARGGPVTRGVAPARGRGGPSQGKPPSVGRGSSTPAKSEEKETQDTPNKVEPKKEPPEAEKSDQQESTVVQPGNTRCCESCQMNMYHGISLKSFMFTFQFLHACEHTCLSVTDHKSFSVQSVVFSAPWCFRHFFSQPFPLQLQPLDFSF